MKQEPQELLKVKEEYGDYIYDYLKGGWETGDLGDDSDFLEIAEDCYAQFMLQAEGYS